MKRSLFVPLLPLTLSLSACSTASAALWPVEETVPATIVDVRVVPRTSTVTSSSPLAVDESFAAVAQAVASSPGSRVRVYDASCPPALVLDETAAPLPARPRAIPRHVERETARLVDRLRDTTNDDAPRRRGVCVAEAITLAASADALADADEVHLVVLGPLAEESRFARLGRGRLPTPRVLARRANAQRLLPEGVLAGTRVHLAAHSPMAGVSFGRSQAVTELWVGLFESAGAHDVAVTSGAPVLDEGVVSSDAEEEE